VVGTVLPGKLLIEQTDLRVGLKMKAILFATALTALGTAAYVMLGIALASVG
jgi:hypothetical protein